jgi:hypothetical protein
MSCQHPKLYDPLWFQLHTGCNTSNHAGRVGRSLETRPLVRVRTMRYVVSLAEGVNSLISPFIFQ